MSSLIINVVGCPILKQNGRFEKSTAGIPFDFSWLNGSARRGGEDREVSTIGKQKALIFQKNPLFDVPISSLDFSSAVVVRDFARYGTMVCFRRSCDGDTKKPPQCDGGE
jgi:hypothetical protein